MKIFFVNTFALLVVLLCISHHVHGQVEKESVDSINALVQKLSSDTEKVKMLIDKSSVMYCEDSASKIIIAKEAKQLAENIGWHEGIYAATRNLGQIYFKCQKNYAKTFEYLQENAVTARNFHDVINEAIALETIAKYYRKLRQYERSLDYYGQVLKLKPGITIEPGILGDMGVVYKEIGDYPRALSWFDSAIHLLSATGKSKKMSLQDTLMITGLLLDKGDIYLASANPDPEEAAYYYTKARDISQLIHDTQFLIWSLNDIGRSFALKKDYKNAIENYQNALNNCSVIHDFVSTVNIQNELANTYSETWDLVRALAYADSARKLAEDQQYVDLLPKAYTTVGNIYLKQDKYDLAINSLLKALDISRQTNILEDQKNALYSLSDAYRHNGQWREAFDASQNYYAIRDSVYNIAFLNRLTRKELEVSFKDNEEIERARQEGEYGRKIERQKVLTYCAIGGIVLVLLLVFFVYRNYNIQKKYNDLLSKEKKRHLEHIEAQSNILSDIAHTQAHDVRGPLATILGLVQVYNFDDPEDPMNRQVVEWVGATAEKLDVIIKEVIIKENRLRNEQRKKGELDA